MENTLRKFVKGSNQLIFLYFQQYVYKSNLQLENISTEIKCVIDLEICCLHPV